MILRQCQHLALLLAMVWITAAADAQETEERERVAQVLGSVESPDLNLTLLPEPGLSARQEISRPDAKGLRFHFRFAGREEAGETWSLRILDASGQSVYSIWASEMKSDEVWSPEITGATATLEIYSVRPATPLRVTLDRLVVLNADPVAATPFADSLASITDQADWLRELGRAVARLRIATDAGWYQFCTGFLVSRDLMLTNEHCIASDTERASVIVDFDYDSPAAQPVTARLSELVGTQENLDYALVRLSRPVDDRAPLRLDPVALAQGQPLLIIQHPEGKPKYVSITGCVVDGLRIPGRRTAEKLDFGHRCDTMKGSSGSPVLDPQHGTVVGLHHLGVRGSSNILVNSAVPIGRILEDLAPAVRNEIQGPPPPPAPGG